MRARTPAKLPRSGWSSFVWRMASRPSRQSSTGVKEEAMAEPIESSIASAVASTAVSVACEMPAVLALAQALDAEPHVLQSASGVDPRCDGVADVGGREA